MSTYTLKNASLLMGVLLGFVVCLVPQLVSAQALNVSFEQTPLFNEIGVAPGVVVTRSVTVTNNGSEVESVYTSTQNVSSTGLSDYIHIAVTKDTVVYVSTTTLTDFFASEPTALGQLDPGASAVYSYTASIPSTTNIPQDSRAQFDLVVGFEGGEFVTDGGGGGGNGTRISLVETPQTPDGEVAGESISLPVAVQDFIDDTVTSFFEGIGLGTVAGTSTDTEVDSSTSTTEETDSDAVPSTQAVSLDDESDCTFWWLLLLGLISLLWSSIDDGIRTVRKSLLLQNALISALYLASVVLGFVFNAIDSIWPILALFWVSTVAYDYFVHTHLEMWSGSLRNLFYILASVGLILSSLAVSFPCVWWPFAVVLILSLLTLALDSH